MASLKGPKHGGANVKVTQMFDDMMEKVSDWEDDDEVRRYLTDLLDKKAFDRKGLIYGMGHAIYSVSDPRADIFKKFVKQLAREKGCEKEYALYEKVEHMAPDLYIVCWIFHRHFIHRSLRQRVSSDGVHTVWKSLRM